MDMPGIGTIQALQSTFIHQKIARERPYPFQDCSEREKHGQSQGQSWMAPTCPEIKDGVTHTLVNFEKAAHPASDADL
jgi:hypothetical protein